MKVRYWYQCRKDRCGCTFHMVPLGEEAPKKIKCAWCGQWAEHGSPVPGTGITNLRPEITPHFNPSIGCHVEDRKHLEHLQKKHGLTDFSPADVGQPSTDWK